MATLKHIPSKNADYGKSLEYLIFQHKENRVPVRDEEGNMLMCDQFLLNGINCNPYSYDKECEKLNWQYHKNLKPGDVKSHHYIISFDPKDQTEGLLTPERAQELGMEFAARHFPGHQTLVCTHNDGHNGSGNIHVHIIFNSLRKLDVEKQPYMDRDIDCRAGYKHHPNEMSLRRLKGELMSLCEREGLHQVDLLSPARSKITNEEYRASQRGQEKLDKLNEEIIADQMIPAQTKFQTQKQYLRDAIADAAGQAVTPEEFKKILREKYGIETKDRRGRFSYLHPDRNKYITDRALGTDYEKEAILKQIEMAAPSHYDPAHDYHADPIPILYIRSNLRLVVDLQTCVKAQINEAYANKVKLSNLKEMARTIVFIQENGIGDRETLKQKLADAEKRITETKASLQSVEERLRQTNEQIHYAGQYYATRSVHADFLKAWNKGRFRSQHKEELAKYDEATKFFHEKTEGKIPPMETLKAQKEQLLDSKKKQQEEIRKLYSSRKVLQTAAENVDAILSDGLSRRQARTDQQQIRTVEPTDTAATACRQQDVTQAQRTSNPEH